MKSGIKTLITGGVLFIFGGVVAPLLIIFPFLFNEVAEEQFLVPGSYETIVEEPGRYYLWNDFRTVYGGESFHRSEEVPDGLSISVVDASGNVLAFRSDNSISSKTGKSSKNSIGYVEVNDPGELQVSVSGDIEKRVFSFSKSSLSKMFAVIFGGIAFSVLIGFLGMGVMIWGVIKLIRNKSSNVDSDLGESASGASGES